QYLHKVNVSEAERMEVEAAREPAEAATPEAVPSRQRPIVIEKVEFLGPDGDPTHVAEPKAPLTVRVHFRCRTPLENPLFSMAVENENDVFVANPGIQPTHAPGPTYVGPGHVDYRMEQLPLGPGEYTFTIAAHDTDGTTILDKKERFASLKVQPGPEVVFGIVDLLGHWTPLVADQGETG
ncbi:MAG TPA: Wzt carbohydrate-binding domain-containing protein, partial [Acidimicrobiales bacterium]